jgi:hypothetical protein
LSREVKYKLEVGRDDRREVSDVSCIVIGRQSQEVCQYARVHPE